MTPEERKEYNKNYYSLKKNEILGKACEKIQCEICSRYVIRNNMIKHYKSNLCKNKQALNNMIKERLIKEID
jgi:hypothetical protein